MKIDPLKFLLRDYQKQGTPFPYEYTAQLLKMLEVAKGVLLKVQDDCPEDADYYGVDEALAEMKRLEDE